MDNSITVFDCCFDCRRITVKGKYDYIKLDDMESGIRQAVIVLSDKHKCLECINKELLEGSEKK